MSGIEQILSSGKCPGLIISSGKTEQRRIEDQRAKDTLKACKWIEDRDGSRFMQGMTPDIGPNLIRHVWQSELADPRKNSITERYDDAYARAEEAVFKLEEKE